MRPIQDLAGMVFGRLTALERFATTGATKKSKWKCKCACGAITDVYATHLIRGNSKSCKRCLGVAVKSMPAHASWDAMLSRCGNPNHEAYRHYGGRGITVCERWRVFANFLSDMGPRPDGKTLERLDVNGNYEPANCCWATAREQANNRRNSRLVRFNGELLTVSQVASATGEPYQTIYSRLTRKELRRVNAKS